MTLLIIWKSRSRSRLLATVSARTRVDLSEIFDRQLRVGEEIAVPLRVQLRLAADGAGDDQVLTVLAYAHRLACCFPDTAPVVVSSTSGSPPSLRRPALARSSLITTSSRVRRSSDDGPVAVTGRAYPGLER